MKILSRLTIIIVFTMLLFGCDAIEYHPYDVRIKYRNLNKKSIALIEDKCREKEVIRFVWTGDSQRFYDETDLLVKNINRRNDIDFVMHGGDLTDFGLRREYEWSHEILRNLKVPYITLIGNHDILGNGLSVFKSMYGALNFSFIAGKTKFVCLNTNALEFDYNEPVPDFEFLLKEIADTVKLDYSQTIVAMHSNPGDMQFNNNAGLIFQALIKQMKQLRFCMHAHTHRYEVNDYFDDGVLYFSCPTVNKRAYLIFTVEETFYTYEVVNF